ncbi:unnamed protein product, partial [Lymnaea stagnalis]
LGVSGLAVPAQGHMFHLARRAGNGEFIPCVDICSRVSGTRLVKVADVWDQAKAEVLQERHDQLLQKLALQHSLVKAQDRRAALIRQDEEEAKVKKRNEEKRLKELKLASLKEQFKKSLADSDRSSKHKSPANGAKTSAQDNLEEVSATSPPVTRKNSRKIGVSQQAYLPTDDHVTSLMLKLEDENRNHANNEKEASEMGSSPLYQAPLLQQEKNSDITSQYRAQSERRKNANPTLKNLQGHLGAEHIWTSLRTDSISKLQEMDQRFPQELKEAVSSHVREGIAKHKKPVFRNFTVTEDVPDLKLLMDQSLLRSIRLLRHKTELMYRSSQTNKDRSNILLHNNPLPDVSGEEESIDKYLIPWDDNASDVSEASYMRWITGPESSKGNNMKAICDVEEKENMEEVVPSIEVRKYPLSAPSQVSSDASQNLQNVWSSAVARQPPRREPRYHFLTEKECTTEGKFLSKLGLDKNKTDFSSTQVVPQALHGRLPSIEEDYTKNTRKILTFEFCFSPMHFKESESTISGKKSRNIKQLESPWQPLSLNALLEYKQQVAADGNGEFQQGRPKMWTLTTASVQ